jgi:hypothetical protein
MLLSVRQFLVMQALCRYHFWNLGGKDNSMSGFKENGNNNYNGAASSDDSMVVEAPARPAKSGSGKGDVTSWDAYRNWLTKVQAPEQRRSLPDPALFSFKGYRSWAEKVRRDWEPDD